MVIPWVGSVGGVESAANSVSIQIKKKFDFCCDYNYKRTKQDLHQKLSLVHYKMEFPWIALLGILLFTDWILKSIDIWDLTWHAVVVWNSCPWSKDLSKLDLV